MADVPAIEVDDLKKTYSDGFFGKTGVEALKGISFSVKKGEIFGLLGPNGAGKTTFVKLLLGIVRKSGGEASVFGHPAGSKDCRRLVGYLPENLRMRGHHTAHTALEYYGQLHNMPAREARERSEELLEIVGLKERASDGIRKYSKGMLQRLGLAQALLHEPQMLILDEPTDGLDPKARHQVRSILTRLQKEMGTTIFLNSHILQEVELVCDRVAILDQGQLRYVGSVKEIGDRRKKGAEAVTAAQQHQAEIVATSAASQQTELEVDLELEGAEQAIRAAFQDRAVQKLEAIGPNEFRVGVRMPDQAAVDQCVDELRRNGVNIIGLSRRRVTLEAAFLEIIAEPGD